MVSISICGTKGQAAKSLGLPYKGAHVVTDTLHFFGSFPLYGDLERAGVEVTWVRHEDGRIPLDAIERAVRRGTQQRSRCP